MKKNILGVLLALILVTGCTGFNANTAVTTASDVGLVLVLKNNPQYKAPTLLVLNGVKTFLAGNVTYDQLVAEISKYAGNDYAYIVAIIMSDLSTDMPLSTSMIPMLDSYKVDLIKRIDHYIMIASM